MSLPLKDVHPGLAPPWWPPAPGWWLLLGALLLLALGGCWLWRRRQRRLAAWLREFDEALAQADSPVAEIAALSALLRRAARRIDPEADRLQGADWLRFLDRGLKAPAFEHGAGALLAEGGFRPSADPAAVAALRALVRERYRTWWPSA